MTSVFKHFTAWLGLSLAATATAYPLDVTQPNVQNFAERLTQDGFTREEVLDWLAAVDVKPVILRAMDRPSTGRPWHQFAPNFINAKRIQQGVRFWQAHSDTLAAAEKQYGVPASIIVAILGAETNYGQGTGTWRGLDALSTLAFHYPRRAEFFQDELRAFLLLSRDEGLHPTAPLSSFAGALGWPQFMPSNVRALAVDFDGDGHKNLWSNPADVIGSVAHFLKVKGWVYGGPVAVQADVQATEATVEKLLGEKFKLHYTLSELAPLGITPKTELASENKAVLFTLETKDGTEYWLGLQNFYAITRYNKSVNYAMAVWQLGEAVKESLPANLK